MSEHDDTLELVQAAGRNDPAAIEALLERYLPQVRAFVRLRAGRMIRARESTSDLVQSVCREVLDHIDRFQYPSEDAFKRWLYTTALRKIAHRRDYYLAKKRDVLREVRPEDEAQLGELYRSFSTPSRALVSAEERERIEVAFDALSPEHREVITLAHVAGLSRSAIAEQMGKSETAVRSLLHRALLRLSDVLRDESSD